MKDKYDSIKLPNIKRNVVPSVIAEKLVSVQYLPECVGDIVPARVVTTTTVTHEFGDRIHDFVFGWQIHDGSEFVSLEEFLERFSKEQIKPWTDE